MLQLQCLVDQRKPQWPASTVFSSNFRKWKSFVLFLFLSTYWSTHVTWLMKMWPLVIRQCRTYRLHCVGEMPFPVGTMSCTKSQWYLPIMIDMKVSLYCFTAACWSDISSALKGSNSRITLLLLWHLMGSWIYIVLLIRSLSLSSVNKQQSVHKPALDDGGQNTRSQLTSFLSTFCSLCRSMFPTWKTVTHCRKALV